MIVPMKKVSLVMLEAEKYSALKKMRKIGLVHLDELEGKGDTLNELRENLQLVNRAISILSEFKIAKKYVRNMSVADFDALETAQSIVSDFEEKKECEDKIAASVAELDRLKLWGDINLEDLQFLSTKNLQLYLYEIPNEQYYEISDDIQTLFINKDKNITRFLLVGYGDSSVSEQIAQKLPSEAYSVILPAKSSESLRQDIDELALKSKNLGEKLHAEFPMLPLLKHNVQKISKELEFENVATGMFSEDAQNAHALSWISGYVPTEDVSALKALAQSENWAVCFSEPTLEDAVPTKLKNNPVVSIITPLLDFLGTVPGYREYDMSLWFLLFFSIFFGMIFGDAGYGSLLLLISFGGMIGAVKNKKSIPQAFMLLFVLSITTIAWGTVTGSWFGMPQALLPDFLKNLSLPAFNIENPDSGIAVQTFCFVLAVVHLSIAHVMTLFRNIKERSLRLFADIGSLTILWGMFNVVLNMLISAQKFPVTNVTIAFIVGGFVLSFIFSNYEDSIVKSIVSSLTNIISVFLGVINFFSDIVSYIRLWAVGVAGLAIAQTVNALAGPMLGSFLLFVGIILLVFGHGLNMVLNVLSVIVHGVRLNTLEFTNHLGMTWSGFKYEPFSE